MQVIEGNIDEIATMHPRLYLEHHIVMAVALLQQISASPCDLQVTCDGVSFSTIRDSKFVLRVHWQQAVEDAADRVLYSEQRNPIVERAAIAVAALLLGKTMPQLQMFVATPGDRVDFLLPEIEHAVEISGTDSKDALTARARRKKKQVQSNNHRWPGHAIVCCFDRTQPEIHWSQVNYGAKS